MHSIQKADLNRTTFNLFDGKVVGACTYGILYRRVVVDEKPIASLLHTYASSWWNWVLEINCDAHKLTLTSELSNRTIKMSSSTINLLDNGVTLSLRDIR